MTTWTIYRNGTRLGNFTGSRISAMLHAVLIYGAGTYRVVPE